jgi:hypothetical protein
VPTSFAYFLVDFLDPKLKSGKFSGRIDSIDWEPWLVDVGGAKCMGFHRHVWDARATSCERFKVALPDFKPTVAEDFIVRAMRLLNITLGREETDENLSMPTT